ncbi:MAG: phosphoenolpyruvate carboxylase, partial [Sphingomonadaceae bacterium]|nr:phosphoenolpyruvate carboxylase [Sphingomonadaceae bacterium]
MTLLARLDARLQELHRRTAETPLFNPVFQLSLELSRQIESGELSLGDVATLLAELDCEGLLARAQRLERLVGPVAPEANLTRIAGLADAGTFADFAARWQHPAAHVVFTAHPTFLLTARQSAAVASAASSGAADAATACLAPHERDAITLDSEHRAAMDALTRAQGARDAMVRAALGQARRRWPDQWRSLKPMPLRFATWVGYDMDGRTDISWATSLRYRLEEKAQRLASY